LAYQFIAGQWVPQPTVQTPPVQAQPSTASPGSQSSDNLGPAASTIVSGLASAQVNEASGPQPTAGQSNVAAGLLTGISAILFAFYTNLVSPASHGNFYELYGIAAAVLGGCSLRGGEGSIFGVLVGAALLRVLLPSMIPSILSATALSFAHSCGEFGVVLMVGGKIPGQTTTASLALYDAVETMDMPQSRIWAFLLLGLSAVVLFPALSVGRRLAARNR